MDAAEFDGCSRACRKAGKHTLVWGDCELAVEPEPRISIGGVVTAPDGYPSIVLASIPVSEMADRIEKILRTIPIRLGPNALAILERGETVGLSGSEYRDMALAVAKDLANPPEDAGLESP